MKSKVEVFKINVLHIKRLTIVLSLFGCFINISNCGYIESRSFRLALQQKNCDDAKNILLKSLKSDVYNESSNYNLIHSFVCSGDLVSADKQIDALLKNNSLFPFELYFLKGFILGEMGQIEDALSAYQKALDIRSNIKIKQNMELLLKRDKSGKSGQKKKGKGKEKEDSQTGKDSEGEQEDQEQKDDQSKSNKQNNKDPKESESKKMSQKQIEKIMKEIDGDEKKIRSQGLKIKSKKGSPQNDKNW